MGLKLNPGGVIGALLPLGLWGAAIVLLGQEVAANAMMTTDFVVALGVVPAMALGGAIGNSVWTSRRRARPRDVAQPSGSCSFLMAFGSEGDEERRAATIAELRALGAQVDCLESGGYVVHVSAAEALKPVRDLLSSKQESGFLDFRDRPV